MQHCEVFCGASNQMAFSRFMFQLLNMDLSHDKNSILEFESAYLEVYLYPCSLKR